MQSEHAQGQADGVPDTGIAFHGRIESKKITSILTKFQKSLVAILAPDFQRQMFESACTPQSEDAFIRIVSNFFILTKADGGAGVGMTSNCSRAPLPTLPLLPRPLLPHPRMPYPPRMPRYHLASPLALSSSHLFLSVRLSRAPPPLTHILNREADDAMWATLDDVKKLRWARDVLAVGECKRQFQTTITKAYLQTMANCKNTFYQTMLGSEFHTLRQLLTNCKYDELKTAVWHALLATPLGHTWHALLTTHTVLGRPSLPPSHSWSRWENSSKVVRR